MKVPLPKPEGAELKPADAKVAGAAAATATDQPDATEFMRHGKGSSWVIPYLCSCGKLRILAHH